MWRPVTPLGLTEKQWTMSPIIHLPTGKYLRRYQCRGSGAGSGSVGSICFWASWIRIHKSGMDLDPAPYPSITNEN
jgi:hypothetical protein